MLHKGRFQTNPRGVEALWDMMDQGEYQGFRRTLVGLKLLMVRLGLDYENGFRRTLVGLKHLEHDHPEKQDAGFRRTLVGLKHLSGDVRRLHFGVRRVSDEPSWG